MRPDTETTNAFKYCLAVAAQRAKVKVVFFLAMSNHYHAGIIDSEGRLPEFLEYFHKLFAKHQNVLRGRWENFWAPEQTSVVELVDAEDVLDKMVYTLTNPVKDHLVARAAEWPGATSLAAQLDGQTIRVERPRRFFRSDGPMPDSATIELSLPKVLSDMPRAEYLALLRERINIVESRAMDARKAERRRPVGQRAITKQNPFDRPVSAEPRRGLKPRLACKNTWRRVEALRRNTAFLAAYRAARELIVRGHNVPLPRGSYWLPRFGGHRCEDVPLAA